MLEEQQRVLPRNLSGTVPPGQPASWREPRHTEGCAQPGGAVKHSYSQDLMPASKQAFPAKWIIINDITLCSSMSTEDSHEGGVKLKSFFHSKLTLQEKTGGF